MSWTSLPTRRATVLARLTREGFHGFRLRFRRLVDVFQCLTRNQNAVLSPTRLNEGESSMFHVTADRDSRQAAEVAEFVDREMFTNLHALSGVDTSTSSLA
jgi:hypothetical protein